LYVKVGLLKLLLLLVPIIIIIIMIMIMIIIMIIIIIPVRRLRFWQPLLLNQVTGSMRVGLVTRPSLLIDE